MPFVRRLFLLLLPGLLVLAARAQSLLPAVTQPLPAQSMVIGSAVTVDLKNYFTISGVTGQVAQFDTSQGKFNIEFLAADAPKTVTNFLAYVSAGRYDNTIVHRLAKGFVIQGGGYTAALPPVKVAAFATVQNEFKRSNVRGTLAMAKLGGDPNSATSEWFVNLADNSANLDNQNGGFTVFARVIGGGMTVVDAIAALTAYDFGSPFDNLPLQDVRTGQTAVELGNLVTINNVTPLPIFPASNGDTAVLSMVATSSTPGVATAKLSGSTLTLTGVAAGTANVAVIVTDTNGNATSSQFAITVAAGTSAPAFAAQGQPVSQTMTPGSTVAFAATATGVPAPTYQWRRGTTAIPGATNALLVIKNAGAADAGSYTCVATNSVDTMVSAAATLTLVPTGNPGRLINLSIITPLAAAETMSMGTVLGGANTSGLAAVLARAAGPSLGAFGVPGTLPDPKMSLVATGGGKNNTVATNDNWNGAQALADAFAQVGAFPYTNATTKDAAVIERALPADGYAVQVSDAGTGAGTVLAEIYDASVVATAPRLINVSVIKRIETGKDLSAGFVIRGDTSKTVLVRAIGPGLAAFGVGDRMADPKLELVVSATGALVATNDNWAGQGALSDAGTAVGAFAITNAASADAMLLVTLPPGSYAARVQPNGPGGSALVEVYDVP